MSTVKAGTLRAPRTVGEYLEPKRDNEWVHRWFLREALKAQAQEYRALFEKEQEERAKALAALQEDLARAHDRITDLDRALSYYEASTWESRLQLRWARVKRAVRQFFVFRMTVPRHAELDHAARMLEQYEEAERLAGFDLGGNPVTRSTGPVPSCTDPRD